MSLTSTEIFEAAFPRSRRLAQSAQRVIAGGVCHDSWRLAPYPVAFTEGRGAYKRAIDGQFIIDLWMGHGALMLGHNPPAVREAVERALRCTSHLSGIMPNQIAWAEQICSMVPSAEAVRFTASGTEASLLALRVARAFTGRTRIAKIDGHFHGWHDEALAGYFGPGPSGLDPNLLASIAIAPLEDQEAMSNILADPQIAAVIIEPGGGSSSTLQYDCAYLEELRKLTLNAGCLLIFDEVVTGFRVSPGGVQAVSGVTPDLTVLGKIMSGGFPGGALVGRRDVMGVFGSGLEREGVAVPHSGTFNGNPLSSAAGLATLRALSSGEVQQQVGAFAASLVDSVNRAAEKADVDIRLFRQSSILHLLVGAVTDDVPIAPGPAAISLYGRHAEAYQILRRLMLVEGIDMHPTHGWLSTAHDALVCDEIVQRFNRVFARLPEVADWVTYWTTQAKS